MNIYKINTREGAVIFQKGTSEDSAIYKADLSWSQIEENGIRKLDAEEQEMYREWEERQEAENE